MDPREIAALAAEYAEIAKMPSLVDGQGNELPEAQRLQEIVNLASEEAEAGRPQLHDALSEIDITFTT